MKLTLQETKKKSECQYATCDQCDFSADELQPYWSIQKSMGLHQSANPSHKIRMFRLSDSERTK